MSFCLCFFSTRLLGVCCCALAFVVSLCALGQSADSLRNASLSRLRLGETTILRVAATSPQRSALPLFRLDSLAFVRQGISSTADALRRLPGVNLRDYGGAGGLKTVSVRGLGAAHTLVLLDGMPVEPSQNGQVDFSHFALQAFDRVELAIADADELLLPVRAIGAATVMLHSHERERNVAITLGAFGQRQLRAAYAYRWQQTSVAAAADAQHADNDYPFTLRNIARVTRERRDHSRLATANLNLKMAHQWGKNIELRAQLAHHLYDQELPGQVMLYTQKGTEQQWGRQTFAQLRLTGQHEAWRWMAAAKSAVYKTVYEDVGGQYPDGKLNQSYRHHDHLVTLGAQRQLAETWQFALTSDYSFAKLTSNLNTDNRVARHSWQSALSLRFLPPSVAVTARLLWHHFWNSVEHSARAAVGLPWQSGEVPRSQHRITPSVSVAWQVANGNQFRMRLRSHYRELFRMPSFTESYYFHYGNTRLRPEVARQIGLGATMQLMPEGRGRTVVAITIDGYRNRVTDRIVAIPIAQNVWRTTNLGRVDANGVDLTLNGQHSLSQHHKLLLAVSASWQQVRDHTNPTANSYDKQIAYAPQHTASVAMTWENPLLSVAIHLHRVGQRWATNEHADGTELPAYYEVGATAYKNFTIRKQRFVLRLVGTNLLDHQYEIVHRYPMPGRAWQTILTWNF